MILMICRTRRTLLRAHLCAPRAAAGKTYYAPICARPRDMTYEYFAAMRLSMSADIIAWRSRCSGDLRRLTVVWSRYVFPVHSQSASGCHVLLLFLLCLGRAAALSPSGEALLSTRPGMSDFVSVIIWSAVLLWVRVAAMPRSPDAAEATRAF